jgi:predicted N-acetyltransferase YhbS
MKENLTFKLLTKDDIPEISILGDPINFYQKIGFNKIENNDFQIRKENFEFIAISKQMECIRWLTIYKKK